MPVTIFYILFDIEMCDVPTIELNNGVLIPALGLGTWQGPPGKEAEVGQAVRDAIDLGYRHFDCAYVYRNEHIIGEALAEKIADGTVTRKELFIVTKLWTTFYRPELIEPMLRSQLKNLRLDYVDLYLIHWPHGLKEGDELQPTDTATDELIFSNHDYLDTWVVMEQLQKKGLTRSIGISNFNSLQIERLLSKATIVPVINQVECHAYLNQKKLRNFCKQRGIVLTSYSPLGSPERPWKKPGDPDVLNDPKIKLIAERYCKTPAQILLRYNVQLGNVVIPKSSNVRRLKENISVFDFELTTDDMDFIDTFDCNERVCPCIKARNHPFYPFKPDIDF